MSFDAPEDFFEPEEPEDFAAPFEEEGPPDEQEIEKAHVPDHFCVATPFGRSEVALAKINVAVRTLQDAAASSATGSGSSADTTGSGTSAGTAAFNSSSMEIVTARGRSPTLPTVACSLAQPPARVGMRFVYSIAIPINLLSFVFCFSQACLKGLNQPSISECFLHEVDCPTTSASARQTPPGGIGGI